MTSLSLQNHPFSQTLIFVHIPRTGGTTFRYILRNQYGDRHIYFIPVKRRSEKIEGLKKLPDCVTKRIRVVMGHIQFGLHDYLRQPSSYITFLRDPVERVLSHYHYVRNHPEHHLHQLVLRNNLGIKDYVASALTKELENGETRQLLRQPKRRICICHHEQEILEEVIDNLNRFFSMVGILEHFDGSLVLAKKKFGWTPPYYRISNVAKKHNVAPLDADTIQVIRHYNRVDEKLYRLASDYVGRETKGLAKEVAAFSRKNQLFGRHVFFFKRAFRTCKLR